MRLGVDYYPEHWEKEKIDVDLMRMKEMGVNAVRIGEFAWSLMEPSENKFDFTFFDHVIAKCKEYELEVMFGTPTATFPAWLGKKEPSIYIISKDGQKMAFGGRRQYCYNSPEYLYYSLRIVEKLVTHYRTEESLYSWQIDNELGHEGSDDCYCLNCHQAFQTYLRSNYVNIETLNETWGTIFWGQTYHSFEEIPMPTETITVHNPAMRLDWARFRSASLNQFAQKHIEKVRELKGGHQTVTTNLPGGFFEKWFDHNEFSRSLDYVSYDNYPVWGGLEKPVSPAALSLSLDFVRGLTGKNFTVVEQLMGAQGHDITGYLPRPNQAKLWSYHAMAHGTNNLYYFRWRGMTRGAEQNCLGILDADDQKTRKYEEAKDFFEDISDYKEAIDGPIKAEIALLYDFDSVWAWRIQRESARFNINEEFLRLYEPFYKKNLPIDVIRKDADLSNYKILLIPVMKITDTSFTAKLEQFTKDGGTVVFSFRAGVKDEHNNLRLGSRPPGPFSSLLGISIEEVESLGDGQRFSVTNGTEEYHKGEVWREMVRVNEAEALYTYNDAFYSDYAAVTVNKFGAGQAYYIAGGIESGIIDRLAKKMLEKQNLETIASDEGVEVVQRSTLEGKTYQFVMNHTGLLKQHNGINLEPYECKILNL
ncbi:beta-galactosidase [Salipaludibacillus sp. HK11]|uniref:beta-galactosidase n=1 Tax=Salipaludibacillus sp. HK11 TaxID=3394320 RepID=UPI0039FC381A